MTHDTIRPALRPWWKRGTLWFAACAALVFLVAGIVIEQAGKPAVISYGAFLDQLDAGNVLAVTFNGTGMTGRLRHAVVGPASGGTTKTDAFASRVPDFGDPVLIPELRKQHAAIDVASSWTRLLAGLPLPMLLFLGVMLVASLIRLVRGRKAETGGAIPMHPMQGMMSLVASAFAKNRTANLPEGSTNKKPER